MVIKNEKLPFYDVNHLSGYINVFFLKRHFKKEKQDKVDQLIVSTDFD